MTYDEIIEQTEGFSRLVQIIANLYEQNERLLIKIEELENRMAQNNTEIHEEMKGRMDYIESELVRSRAFRYDLMDAIQRNL